MEYMNTFQSSETKEVLSNKNLQASLLSNLHASTSKKHLFSEKTMKASFKKKGQVS